MPPARTTGGHVRRRCWEGFVDDPAVPQEHDPVGPGRVGGVVGHQETRAARIAVGPQQPHDDLAVDGVECARRLVSEEDPAAPHDGSRDGDALLLAAGQVVRKAVGQVHEADPVKRLQGGDPRRATTDPIELQRQRHILGRRQPGQQVEVLEHVADRPATEHRQAGAVERGDVDAGHQDVARRGPIETTHQRQEGGLAGAARPHDRHQLTLAHGQVGRSQGHHPGVPAAMDASHGPQLDGRPRAGSRRHRTASAVHDRAWPAVPASRRASRASHASSQRTSASARKMSASSIISSARSSGSAVALRRVYACSTDTIDDR